MSSIYLYFNLDGTGYAEDGRDFFEDEDGYSDDDTEKTSKRNQNKGTKKRPRDSDKPVKGKGSIRNLFSNAVPKKTSAASIKDDDILADILGELQGQPNDASTSSGPSTSSAGDKHSKVIAPAKIISNSSRKSDATLAKEYMNNFMNNLKTKEPAKTTTDKGNTDDELLDSILKAKPNENSKTVSKVPVVANKVLKEALPNKESEEDTLNAASSDTVASTEKHSIPDDDMDFSCLQDDENQFELEKTMSTTSAKTEEKSPVKPIVNSEPTELKKSTVNQEEDIQNLLKNWENICQMDSFEQELNTSTANSSETVGETTENLRFWYWEAWEDPVRRPGEVFLFGRTEDGKSICVRIEKIDRVVYLLPREYVSR